MEKLQEEKKVDYIELFFDLIFVYTFRTVNALVTHGDRFPSFLYGNQHGESVFGALYTLSSRLCCGFFQFGTPLLSPK